MTDSNSEHQDVQSEKLKNNQQLLIKYFHGNTYSVNTID